MKFWSPFPFMRLLLPFVCGIVLSIHFNLKGNVPVIVFVILILLMLLHVLYGSILINFRTRWIFGFIVNVLLLLYGLNWGIQFLKPDYIQNEQEGNETSAIFYVRVLKPLSERENSYRGIVRVISKKKTAIGNG